MWTSVPTGPPARWRAKTIYKGASNGEVIDAARLPASLKAVGRADVLAAPDENGPGRVGRTERWVNHMFLVGNVGLPPPPGASSKTRRGGGV